MALGPIELLVISFPGNQFKGEIIPALRELSDKQTIRIIDIIVAVKDSDGTVTIAELADVDEETYAVFDPVAAGVSGILDEEDVRELALALEPNSSAGIMLFENTWARDFVGSVERAKGELVFDARVPASVVKKVQEQLVAQR